MGLQSPGWRGGFPDHSNLSASFPGNGSDVVFFHVKRSDHGEIQSLHLGPNQTQELMLYLELSPSAILPFYFSVPPWFGFPLLVGIIPPYVRQALFSVGHELRDQGHGSSVSSGCRQR